MKPARLARQLIHGKAQKRLTLYRVVHLVGRHLLWRRGQRTWMLASWAQPSSSCPGSPCANCTATDCASGAKSPALVAAFLDDIAAALRAAQAAGWPANATSVYIGDEIKTSEVWGWPRGCY